MAGPFTSTRASSKSGKLTFSSRTNTSPTQPTPAMTIGKSSSGRSSERSLAPSRVG